MNLIAEVKDITQWPDIDLAAMTGLNRMAINRACHGRRIRMRDMRTDQLRDALEEMRDKLNEILLYIDMTS